MKHLCVFCGSSPGAHPDYVEGARALGQTLAAEGIGLVYGGARVGTMGAVADAVLAAGGKVTGIIPRALAERAIAHEKLTALHVVETMHKRKAMMANLSDGFIALPGGIGTLEELFEIMGAGQLAFHDKPFGLLNVRGYYDALLAFLDHSVEQGFVEPEHRAMLLVDKDAAGLLAQFRTYQPPTIDKTARALRMTRNAGLGR